MKLSKENIQFIDKYLENSGIEYKDIRIEILDHVASSIEAEISEGDKRSFYYVFKDYMIINKARLLNDNKEFLKSIDKKIVKMLFKDLLTITGLIIFALLFFGFNLIYKYFDFNHFKNILLGTSLILSFGLGGIYFIAIKIFRLDRYSITERIGFPIVSIFNILIAVNNIYRINTNDFNTIIVITIVSLSITFLLLLFKHTFSLVKTYRVRFNSLV